MTVIRYTSCHGNEQHTTLTTEQWNDLERFKRVPAKKQAKPAGAGGISRTAFRQECNLKRQ